MRNPVVFLFLALLFVPFVCLRAQEPIIVDHSCTNLPTVPDEWVAIAKDSLHIAYGHTSHGSQVADGMTGLVTFTGGCGGPQFAWNNGGSGGALDLHDYAMAGDCGYYPQWVNETRAYLDDPAHGDVNVIIWSWCGQHSDYTEQDMIDKYLAPMTQLELDYSDVMFVYMTGHLNYWSMTNTNARNQQIRDYCIANNKILYDFAHIESHNPDGAYFPYANDDCGYWDEFGVYQGNWAEEWQSGHVEGVEWYNCNCAHSRPLNGNQKAYAAWWLWARLAGWPGISLAANRESISASAGGAFQFDLDAGTRYAGRDYILFGSLSGTDPGTPLPGGLFTIPLNRDWFTDLLITRLGWPNYQGFYGTLDSAGEAVAQTNAPAGGLSNLVGSTMSFAFGVNNPWDFASTAVDIVIDP